MQEHTPVGLIVIFEHIFITCLHVYLPGLGLFERVFTAEGPWEVTGVGIGTPVGCSVGDADGFVKISR